MSARTVGSEILRHRLVRDAASGEDASENIGMAMRLGDRERAGFAGGVEAGAPGSAQSRGGHAEDEAIRFPALDG